MKKGWIYGIALLAAAAGCGEKTGSQEIRTVPVGGSMESEEMRTIPPGYSMPPRGETEGEEIRTFPASYSTPKGPKSRRIGLREEVLFGSYLPDGTRQGYATTFYDNGKTASTAVAPWELGAVNDLTEAQKREIQATRWEGNAALHPLSVNRAIEHARRAGRIR